jgi:hypothetical protein
VAQLYEIDFFIAIDELQHQFPLLIYPLKHLHNQEEILILNDFIEVGWFEPSLQLDEYLDWVQRLQLRQWVERKYFISYLLSWSSYSSSLYNLIDLLSLILVFILFSSFLIVWRLIHSYFLLLLTLIWVFHCVIGHTDVDYFQALLSCTE